MATSHRDSKPEIPKLVSVEDLARAWSTTPGTIRRWCREAQIPAIRIGAQWRFRVSDLERIVASAHERRS